MEVERIFSAEQIKIHPELPKIIKDYTKAIIRANPDDIIEFSYLFFKEKVEYAERLKQEKLASEEDNVETNADLME